MANIPNAKAEVTVKITISNVPSEWEAINKLEFDSFEDCILWLIKEDGNFIGLMDNEYEIISVKEIK